MKYDVVIIGAGPGGIFSTYELMKQNENQRQQLSEGWKVMNLGQDGDEIEMLCARKWGRK